MYPDDCIQSIIGKGEWWVKNGEKKLCRGAIIYSFAPHVDQTPYTFEPIARAEATQHTKAIIKVAPLKVDQPLKQVNLPVAAMPLHGREVWAAYRAKKRPCLVLGSNSPCVARDLVRGMPNSSTANTILAAPYYGVDQNGQRAGFNPKFVERVRHCEYPQFVWDSLPISTKVSESILRLDHLQPIGTHHNSYDILDFRLSDDAIEIMDELLQWLIWGGVSEDSLIAMYRAEIEDMFDK